MRDCSYGFLLIALFSLVFLSIPSTRRSTRHSNSSDFEFQVTGSAEKKSSPWLPLATWQFDQAPPIRNSLLSLVSLSSHRQNGLTHNLLQDPLPRHLRQLGMVLGSREAH